MVSAFEMDFGLVKVGSQKIICYPDLHFGVCRVFLEYAFWECKRWYTEPKRSPNPPTSASKALDVHCKFQSAVSLILSRCLRLRQTEHNHLVVLAYIQWMKWHQIPLAYLENNWTGQTKNLVKWCDLYSYIYYIHQKYIGSDYATKLSELTMVVENWFLIQMSKLY